MENDICIYYHRGNRESVNAHSKAKKTSSSKRKFIYEFIRKAKGITCEDIEIATGWKHQTVSARISELKRDKAIIPVGKRKTRSGCNAALYGPRYPRQSPMF